MYSFFPLMPLPVDKDVDFMLSVGEDLMVWFCVYAANGPALPASALKLDPSMDSMTAGMAHLQEEVTEQTVKSKAELYLELPAP